MQARDVKQLSAAMRTAPLVIMRVDADTGRLIFSDNEKTIALSTLDVATGSKNIFSRFAEDKLPSNDVAPYFKASFLETFARIGKRRNQPVGFVTDAGRKPTHVRIGADYRAWLMPYTEAECVTWLASSF
jgi:hypothetical protein